MSKSIEKHGTNIPCDREVQLLDITIDEKLQFSQFHGR